MEAQVRSRSSKKRTKWFDAECDVAALPKHTKNNSKSCFATANRRLILQEWDKMASDWSSVL